MKKIMSVALGLFFTLTLFSQTTSTVTIVLKGSQEWTVAIDGRAYTPYVSATNETTVVATDLSAGSHDLRVIRNSGSWYNRDMRSTFILRSNYDKTLIVNANGTIEQTETANTYGAGTRAPMSSYDFQVLMISIQNRRGYEKRAALRDAFESGDHSFTALQTKQLLQQVTSESQRLELAKMAYASVTDQWNFDNQILPLFRSTANRNQLRAYTRDYSPVDNDNYPGTGNAMSDASFNNLYANIQGQYNQSTRYYLATNAFSSSSNYFTSNQAARIITLLNDEGNRLELAKLAYRRVTDQNNFSRVFDLLYSRSSRDQLTTYINSVTTGTGGVYYPPMSTTTFNSLYSDVQNTFGLGAKQTKLENLFSNNTYYFTTAQAEQLIRLVSSETNRLKLAKLSYSRITDPSNFSQLYDVLGSQSSRNELDIYVRNNRNTNSDYNDNGFPSRIGVTDGEFNATYSDISRRFGIGVKYSALTDLFTRNDQNFTVAQTSKLITLVSDEDNRLQLAKLSIDQLVDPENISSLYQIFSSQSSIDELRRYVSR